MIPFYSKRNQVYPCIYSGRGAVEKHFSSLEDWRRESALYKELSARLRLPEVLHNEPGLLVTAHCPYPMLLTVLEKQERTSFAAPPWLALAAWLRRCYKLCGQLPGDGNLRNFLWNEDAETVIGLDLEGYCDRNLVDCGADLIAALLTYEPSHTPVKHQAANTLSEALNIPSAAVRSAEKRLADRRGQTISRPFSGIILAGGMSRRMGTPKKDLLLRGETFLCWQVKKLQLLGIDDIILSGADCPELPGTRRIADQYPGRGPLGGLHACLNAARYVQTLVVTVDTPLVPVNALAHLMKFHTQGVTLSRHGKKVEPLIAVYDSAIAQVIELLIQAGSAPVFRLRDLICWQYFDYGGPEELFLNCNTPADFIHLENLAADYQAQGLPL